MYAAKKLHISPVADSTLLCLHKLVTQWALTRSLNVFVIAWEVYLRVHDDIVLQAIVLRPTFVGRWQLSSLSSGKAMAEQKRITFTHSHVYRNSCRRNWTMIWQVVCFFGESFDCTIELKQSLPSECLDVDDRHTWHVRPAFAQDSHILTQNAVFEEYVVLIAGFCIISPNFI